MSDILISEQMTGPDLEELRQRFKIVFDPELWKAPTQLREMIPDFRALIVRNQTQVDRALISAGARLQVIGRAGAGLDNVDVRAASESGVVVAYAPDQNSNSVAELVLGLMLALARRIPLADHDTRRGGWNRHRLTGIELQGKTLGLVGLGRIGLCTALKARALGMEIVACDPYADPKGFAVAESGARLLGLDELLPLSDFVSCHVPETTSTTNLFSYSRFCQMKLEAYFINSSRGSVVKEEDLARALSEGKIAGAAVDVRSEEPPTRHLFAGLTNVILTPHIGAFTREGQQRVLAALCSDVSAVLDGGAAKHFANFEKPRTPSLRL
ncbi:MAG: hydroxyacid dehydrogenase [Acidobacteriota bacterium]